jgi:hypothetical protein
MIHEEILGPIKRHKPLSEEFVFPDYKAYCISNIAPSICTFFGINHDRLTLPSRLLSKNGNEEKIIMFLIDGQGYNQFLESSTYVKFFNKLVERADVFPMTTVFPSTTPAALTSVHTGLTPQEHGLPEWTVYFEETDKIIETLPFRPIFNPNREAMLQMGGKPEMLYEGSTVYLQLKNHGIKSFVFVSADYSTSAYSRMSQNGAEVVPYADYTQLCQKLLDKVENYKEPAYYFIYWASIDGAMHAHGKHSHEHFMSLAHFSRLIEDEFIQKIKPETAEKVRFLMTADHGQSSIKGEDIIYLNQYLNLEESYLWGKSKNAIHPTGSPHDVFLHIWDPKVPEVLDFLRRELKGKADVLLIDEALDLGLFGLNKPVDKFIKRIGDILILPHKGYHVWYKHAPDAHWHMKGIHGGLVEDEMLVPFVSTNLRNLI